LIDRELVLYLGNRAYSSWSLRAWLAARKTGLPLREQVIPLEPPGTRTTAIAAHSPSGKVPALHDGDLVVWESLAIIEYLAELAPAAGLWPEDRARRAVARSLSAEMAAGFLSLRSEFPMNVRSRVSTPREATGGARADLERIDALLRDCRARHGDGGPFLFGAFSAVDAVYAPVATRMWTYRLPVSEATAAWRDAILRWPDMVLWVEKAAAEPWTIEAYEASVGIEG
jgi:glutathione S-transferase